MTDDTATAINGDTDTLESQIRDALTSRTDWENRQDVFYRMRHGGLRRQSKPFPGAADLHYPLADGLIEKQKPFYAAQLYATETFASLINKKPGQHADQTTAATQWFDYKLRSCSNFETEYQIGVDRMLGAGSSFLKVYWDDKRKQVRFAAPQVTHIIVPSWTEDIQDADWFVQVMCVSVAQYKASKVFSQDPDLLSRIKGSGNTNGTTTGTALDQDKNRREGIDYSSKPDQIIYWEIYQQDHDAGTWTVKTRSPLAFDEPMRADFGLPYKHGMLPFVQFDYEIKEQGVFSSRGVTEIVAAFETSICKNWNQHQDYMSFCSHPMFTSAKDIPNTGNIQMRPGQIMPPGLSAITFPPPPLEFDAEMNHIREIAESRIALPDLNLQQRDGKDPTATQLNLVAGQSASVSDIRTRVMRLALAKVYEQAWALLVQYDSDDLTYTIGDAVEQVQPDVFHTDYQVVPNGTDQSWNRTAQLQRAMARMQAFTGNPWINQGELAKSVLEVDDPRLVKRLWQDSEMQITDQMEEQAVEIGSMILGFPAPVREADDDVAHLKGLFGFVSRRLQLTHEPITPDLAMMLMAHGTAHEQAAVEKKTPGLDQVLQGTKPIIAALHNIAIQLAPPPGQTGAPNLQVLPPPAAGPGAPTTQPDASAAGGGDGDSPAQELGIKALNALATANKSGIHVTPDQVNATMKMIGLPLIPPGAPGVNAPAMPNKPTPPPQPKPEGMAA